MSESKPSDFSSLPASLRREVAAQRLSLIVAAFGDLPAESGEIYRQVAEKCLEQLAPDQLKQMTPEKLKHFIKTYTKDGHALGPRQIKALAQKIKEI